jgi:hypothetical protein
MIQPRKLPLGTRRTRKTFSAAVPANASLLRARLPFSEKELGLRLPPPSFVAKYCPQVLSNARSIARIADAMQRGA